MLIMSPDPVQQDQRSPHDQEGACQAAQGLSTYVFFLHCNVIK